jgi:AraC family transcriptional regulator
MNPRIEILSEKKLVGKRLKMSLAENKTFELWRNFMPRRNEIKNNLTADLFSMQVYDDAAYFQSFNPNAIFEKWAAVEVSDFENIPEGMESYILAGGKYAVFQQKGFSTEIFQYIFGTWLPNSNYELDNREHFELLGEKYKNNDPNSEEEIWIPIKEILK